MKRMTLLGLLAGTLLASPVAAAPPTADVHSLQWYVHVDLIDAGAGMDLAFYQALIDGWEADASALLEGEHGPVDTPCCTRIARSAAVATFGTPGDGRDVFDSAGDYAAIAGFGLPGSRAFLVDSMTYCNGAAPGAIGCAQNPACDGNGNDDPDLYLVTTLDAMDSGIAAQTLAHERGHNACLDHVDTEECQVMRSGGGGGCIDASECANYQAARTATGGSCGCHEAGVGIVADGLSCSDVVGGICSGGLCGDPAGAAATQLIAAAGPGAGSGQPADDALRMSGLPGGWSDLGPFGVAGEVVEGLTYATDSDVLYGVVPTAGDDSLVTIDPATGDITATLATIANGTNEYVALAYDPGPTSAPADDTLLVLETDGTFEELYAIDPAAPGSPTFVGALATGGSDGFRGLAYDSANGRLYTSSPFVDGIYEIDLTTCPFFCGVVQQVGAGVSRFDSGLAYSADTGLLHLVGGQLGVSPLGRRTLYDVIDPNSFTKQMETVQVDAFTTGGLAALPAPAAPAPPKVSAAGWAGLGALALIQLLTGAQRARCGSR